MPSAQIMRSGTETMALLQEQRGAYPEPIARVAAALSRAMDPANALHWRYVLMASAAAMFLLPPADAPSAQVAQP